MASNNQRQLFTLTACEHDLDTDLHPVEIWVVGQTKVRLSMPRYHVLDPVDTLEIWGPGWLALCRWTLSYFSSGKGTDGIEVRRQRMLDFAEKFLEGK